MQEAPKKSSQTKIFSSSSFSKDLKLTETLNYFINFVA